jgi:alanine racemase
MTTVPLRPTMLEIDLDAAADNVRAVRGLVGPERKIFAVVKADGYGFGAAEHTRIDLTAVPAAAVGDEVVIIGRQGDLEITPAEVAARHGLGLHQVATTVGPRVARVYLSAGTPGAEAPLRG